MMETQLAENHKSEEGFSFPICAGKPEVPSRGERQALHAMKSIKDRVRHIKDQLKTLKSSGIHDDAYEVKAAKKELSRLKVEWDSWEEKRQKAAKERMILLGHEKGP